MAAPAAANPNANHPAAPSHPTPASVRPGPAPDGPDTAAGQEPVNRYSAPPGRPADPGPGGYICPSLSGPDRPGHRTRRAWPWTWNPSPSATATTATRPPPTTQAITSGIWWRSETGNATIRPAAAPQPAAISSTPLPGRTAASRARATLGPAVVITTTLSRHPAGEWSNTSPATAPGPPPRAAPTPPDRPPTPSDLCPALEEARGRGFPEEGGDLVAGQRGSEVPARKA